MPAIPPRLAPILLLIGSNLFMTTAWYGHLKFKDKPLWLVVMLSWGLPSSSTGWPFPPTASAAASIPSRS